MKNCLKLFGIIVSVAVIGLSMTACEGPAGPRGQSSYLVVFNPNNTGASPQAAGVIHGGRVAEPANPIRVRTGDTVPYAFYGWYTDRTFTERWDFDNPVTSNITLYAKWVDLGLGGTWLSAWGEEVTIAPTTFSEGFSGDTNYEGPIVNIRANGNAGYITIRFTIVPEWQPAGAVGNYYVIRFYNLTATTMNIAGAGRADPPGSFYIVGGDGEPTQAAAEARFTVAGGYFEMSSEVVKQ